MDPGQADPNSCIPPSYSWLYLASNASGGGYSQSSSLVCGLSTFFSMFSATNQTVVVQGSFTYNTTVQIPLW